MSNLYAIVLAAGKGTRMKSNLYKVLHPVCGKPMVQHIVDRLHLLAAKQIVVVVGHGAEQVKEQLGMTVQYAHQEQQLGTAHAVMASGELLKDKAGTTIVISGDTPLVRTETLKNLIEHHEQSQAAATVVTTVLEDPTGYGRIIRNADGFVERVVEHKDATIGQRQVREINTGIYCFDNQKLFQALAQVKNDNVQGEYYLPDVLQILREQSDLISAYVTDNPKEGIGVNDRVQLSAAEKYLRQRINEQHMKNGVTIIDPDSTYIEADVVIEADTVIHPGTHLKGNTKIGAGCVIGPNAELIDCQVESHVHIRYSVAAGSVIRQAATVGPFSYIRPGSDVGEEAKVGNFVELKNTKLGKKSKVPHLSYVGDSEVGRFVNIGCGAITVNYDGINKHKTIIGDESFIGCNANLVAPVTIGDGAYIAAGSTITDDVASEALAIARARQINKAYYAKKMLKSNKTEIGK